jgi:hypothetical protein
VGEEEERHGMVESKCRCGEEKMDFDREGESKDFIYKSSHCEFFFSRVVHGG